MTSLLLIRHAETDLAGTFCGISDPPINAAGRRQIDDMIERLDSQGLDAVYTSPLQRASTTAHAIVVAFAVPCYVRPALREIDFGRWEGLRWDQVESHDPAYASQWIESFPRLPAPQGEMLTEFEARVHAEIEHLFTLAASRKIAVVTHAGVMRAVLHRVCRLDDQKAWQLTRNYATVLRVGPGVCELVDSVPSTLAVQGGSK